MLQVSMHSHSTNPMILPVLPPILFNAFPARLAAPLMAGPAELVTRERPSDAWLTALEPVCCAFEAALDAASVVEEAFRRLARRRRNCDCRRVARERARGMVGGREEDTEVEMDFEALGELWTSIEEGGPFSRSSPGI
jgi:hypothetical protein